MQFFKSFCALSVTKGMFIVMKKNLLDYTEKFKELGKIRDDSTLSGNYKVNNAAYKKMYKILDMAKQSEDKEQFYLNILTTTTSPTTIITCCAHMLKLNIKPQKAKKKLKEIQKNKSIPPIFASEAKLFLQEWEKGNIKKEF